VLTLRQIRIAACNQGVGRTPHPLHPHVLCLLVAKEVPRLPTTHQLLKHYRRIMNPNGLLLDLHGRRMEEAISDVTVFFDRIRRTYYSSVRPSSSSVTSEGRGGIPLYVTVITGSGSVRSLCGDFLFVSASYCVTNKKSLCCIYTLSIMTTA
jgi:hypothetical protein